MNKRSSPQKINGIYLSKMPEYKIWSFMIERCTNANCKSYSNYGGRGIKVQKSWLGYGGFVNFIKDVGYRPSKGMSLDRIDNDGDYTFYNCRWTDRRTQQLNKRINKSNKSGFRGVSYYDRYKKYQVLIKSATDNIYVGRFEDIEEAALAYDAAAVQVHGSEAKLNILVV